MAKVSDHSSPSPQSSPEQRRGGCDIRVIRSSQQKGHALESRMAELPVRLRTSLRRHYPHQVQGVSSPSFANDFFDDLTSPAKLELDSQPSGSPALSFSLRIRPTRAKSTTSKLPAVRYGRPANLECNCDSAVERFRNAVSRQAAIAERRNRTALCWCGK
jgi:hypothetical protein